MFFLVCGDVSSIQPWQKKNTTCFFFGMLNELLGPMGVLHPTLEFSPKQNMTGMMTCLLCVVSCGFGCSCGLFVIAIVWIYMRPLLGSSRNGPERWVLTISPWKFMWRDYPKSNGPWKMYPYTASKMTTLIYFGYLCWILVAYPWVGCWWKVDFGGEWLQ